MNCPLCGSSRIQVVQSFAALSLPLLYDGTFRELVRENVRDMETMEYACCERCDLRFFYPPRTGSETFYSRLQAVATYYLEEKSEFDQVRPLINPAQDVLEVGCGTGAFGASIRSRRYVGLEFNTEAVAIARAKGLNVRQETVEAHAAANPRAYDVVCAFQVLEHVADPSGFLRGSVAALRLGGTLILSVPNADSFARNVPNFALDLPPHHVTHWTDRCLRGLERLLPLQLIDLRHDALQPAHRRLYVSSILTALAYGLARSRVPVVDLSRFGKTVTWAAGKLSRVFAPLLVFGPSPLGISVTAVYRKTE